MAKARQERYIARSAYKLLHMDDRYHLFDRQHTRVVMDLGCSPGGWCQVVRQRAGDGCFLLGVDLLPIQAQVPKAVIVQGDFTNAATQQTLRQHLATHHSGASTSGGRNGNGSGDTAAAFTGVDVVTSDMCPNRMGGYQDRQRIAQLNLEAVDVCAPLLRTGGHFVCKVLGSRPAYEELWHRLSRLFLNVEVCKPPASRVHSDEAFVVALDKLATPRPASGPHRAADVGRSMRGVAVGAGADGGGGHFGLDDWPGFSRRGGRPRRG